MMKEMTDHYKIENNYWGFIKNKPIFSNIKREDIRFPTDGINETTVVPVTNRNHE